MKQKFNLIFIFLLLVGSYSSFCQTENLWRVFEKGNYEGVVSITKDIKPKKLSSSQLNIIGSAFSRLQKKPEAAYYFFLGLKKDPFNSKLLYNYNLSSMAPYDVNKDKVKQSSLIFISFSLLIILLAFAVKPGLRNNKLMVLGFTFLIISSFVIKHNTEDLNNFFLVQQEKDLKSGIDPAALVFETLKKGEILYITERLSGHFKVRSVFKNKVGWIKK